MPASFDTWPLWAGQHAVRDSIAVTHLSDDETFAVEDGEGFELRSRRTGSTVMEFKGEWRIERAHYSAWLSWWRDVVDSGRKPFWTADPLTFEQRLFVRKPNTDWSVSRIYPAVLYIALELRSVPYA